MGFRSLSGQLPHTLLSDMRVFDMSAMWANEVKISGSMVHA